MENGKNGRIRRKVAILDPLSLRRWNADSVDLGETGASEMMVRNTAMHFQEAGLQVYVIGNHDSRVESDGSIWMEYGEYAELNDLLANTEFEAMVVFREFHRKFDAIKAKRRYLVMTDMGYSSECQLPDGYFDKVFVMSDWHALYAEEQLHMDPSRIRIAPCAPIQSEFESEAMLDRPVKENAMVWSSRYERGLREFVTFIMPKILERVPDFKLYVCQYDDYAGQSVGDVAGAPNIVMMGKLSKKELHHMMRRAKIWVCMNTGWSNQIDASTGRYGEYATTGFHETFCATGIENAMCGNAIICSTLGGFAAAIRGYSDYMISVDSAIYTRDDDPSITSSLQIIKEEYMHMFFGAIAETAVSALTNEMPRSMAADAAKHEALRYCARRSSYTMLVEMGFIDPPQADGVVDIADGGNAAPPQDTQEALNNETLPGEILMNALS